eukprot:c43270_g1_i1 orf=1-414(+)
MIGTHNPIWEDEESRELEDMAQRSTYDSNRDKHNLNRNPSGLSPTGSLNRHPVSQRSGTIKQPLPAKSQNIEKHKPQLSPRHHETSLHRKGSPNALLTLFQSQDAVMVSPSQSSPSSSKSAPEEALQADSDIAITPK